MNFKNTVKKAIYSSCLYFTVIQFLIICFAALYEKLSPSEAENIINYLSLKSAVIIYIGCIVMAFLNFVWKLNMSSIMKGFIHFLGSLGIFTLLFVIIPGAYNIPAQIIVRLSTFIIAYLVIAFVLMIINTLRTIKKSDSQDYEKIFNDKK